MHRKKDDGAQEQAEQAEQAEQEKTGASSGCGRPTTDMEGTQQVGGGLGYVRVCAWTAGAREKAHKLEERAPCSQAGAGGLRKSRFSRTCEREQKRTRSAGDGYGLVSGDEEAVGTGCVLESAHFNLWEGAEGSVRGGMRTVFRYLNLSIYLGLKTAKRAHIRTDLNESN